MIKYQNTKYDFKKYLLDNLNDAHQEELIFWKKSIPLPIDLVYKIFDEGNSLIGEYCGHILSLAIMSKHYSELGFQLEELYDLPSSETLVDIDVSKVYEKHFQDQSIKSLFALLKNTFRFNEFSLSEIEFSRLISHEGRKYKRLYVPKNLKSHIVSLLPNLQSALGVSNGDMFGNIVADYLKIYRSGFSDAFAAIFNKLLDFHLENIEEKREPYSKHQKIRVSQLCEDGGDSKYSILLEKITDGSLWEPAYIDAKTVMRINTNHPYWELVKTNKVNSVTVFQDVLFLLSNLEYESVKDSNKKLLENIRFEISRSLRISSETKGQYY